MNIKAYWLHTDGAIIPVSVTHIAVVISHPEQFGYTLERIAAEYSACNEPIGYEGKARQKIMFNLIRNHGWIRVRYSPRYDSWIVEINTLSVSVRQMLVRFFSLLEIVGTANRATVKISELWLAEGQVLQHLTAVNEILAGIKHGSCESVK